MIDPATAGCANRIDIDAGNNAGAIRREEFAMTMKTRLGKATLVAAIAVLAATGWAQALE